MPSPILARADALMQRRRQSPGESDDIPVLTDSIASPDDDIPLLTDLEQPIEASSPAPTLASTSPDALPATPLEPAAPPQPASPPLTEQLLTELARRVELRLTSELPRLIESTLRDLLAEKAMMDTLPTRD